MASLRRTAAAAALIAGVIIVIVVFGGSHRRARSRPVTAGTAVVFGANVGRLFNGGLYGAAQIDAQLAALAATGARLARSDAQWELSEPEPPHGGVHRYDWSFDDAIAAALAAHGLRWLPIIDYSPRWAQSVPGEDHSPPSAAGDYAAYAGALAARYGPGGSFWRSHPRLRAEPIEVYEIWNEPDSPLFWTPQPDPARYADLYARARAAIRAAASGARVIVGGLAHAQTFIPALLAAAPALRGQLDGVGIHPYGQSPEAVLANVRGARAALDAAGLRAVPLDVTEFGWTTQPPGALDYLPEPLRPGYIRQTLTALGHLGCGIGDVLLYAWLTPERNPSDPNDWFGINPPTGGGSDVRAFASGLRDAIRPGPALAC